MSPELDKLAYDPLWHRHPAASQATEEPTQSPRNPEATTPPEVGDEAPDAVREYLQAIGRRRLLNA